MAAPINLRAGGSGSEALEGSEHSQFYCWESCEGAALAFGQTELPSLHPLAFLKGRAMVAHSGSKVRFEFHPLAWATSDFPCAFRSTALQNESGLHSESQVWANPLPKLAIRDSPELDQGTKPLDLAGAMHTWASPRFKHVGCHF